MNYIKLWGVMFLLLAVLPAKAQKTAIRGTIYDKDTRMEIIGARVMLILGNDTLHQVVTNEWGEFSFGIHPAGRYLISATMIGFESLTITAEHISAKDYVARLELEERVSSMKEVEVTDTEGGRGDAANEMATVSARRFTLEETNRYAGSRGDPARMAANYAGVTGTDDNRNDIVIRGNSPLGVLWKVDGMWIPNPNHFAISGSQGGPVTILNNRVLANSDFYTGAFPAEFGNSTAGVFDLRFRNGNNQKFEFAAQIGVLGTELMAEGPISKKKRSSFLVAYRYATFDLVRMFGVGPETLQKLIGTSAVPAYQDINFRLNFPINQKTNFSITGIGGLSRIDIVLSDQTRPQATELYGDNDRDQYFRTGMGMLIANLSRQVNEKSMLQVTAALGADRQWSNHKYFYRSIDSSGTEPMYVYDTLPKPLMGYRYTTTRASVSTAYTIKVSQRHVIKTGLILHGFQFNMADSSLNNTRTEWLNRWDYNGMSMLAEIYGQWKWRVGEDLTIISGIHSQYLQLGNSFSPIEPRFGLRYRLGKKSEITAGGGLHSQAQPFYTYFYKFQNQAGETGMHNMNMGMTRSWHAVAGYGRALSQSLRVKSEIYYQYLFNIPVEMMPTHFAMINAGSGFVRVFTDQLQNTGTGYNYGAEITIEKHFDKRLFVLLTGTWYQSRYKGSDGIDRNTDYNGSYIVNALAGVELKAGKKGLLNLGGNLTLGGGKRYGYADTLATLANNELIYLSDGYNERQAPMYLRFDIRVSYRINAGNLTHEISLDLVNLTNNKNILGLAYTGNPANPIDFRYQLGFLPLFNYRVDF